MDRDDEVGQTELLFRQQPDGRKVSRLPGGKVVLISLDDVEKVQDGERWIVSLDHRQSFAIARPLEKVEAAAGPTRAIVRVVPHVKPYEGNPRNGDAATRPAPSALIRTTDRVCLFVDGPNTDGAARAAGFFLDFGKARNYFQAGGVPVGAYYFAADFTHQDPMQTRFFDYLSHTGFVVHRKPTKQIEEETGEMRYKCDLNVEVVVELLTTRDQWDVAFLFTGDADYERAVEVLRAHGKRVYVVTHRGNLGRELAYVADKPVFYLDEHRAHLEREPKPVVEEEIQANT